MQLSIAALSTIAKCWSQHKYTRTRIVFSMFIEHLCVPGTMLDPKVNMSLLQDCAEYETTLFCFAFCLSIWNKQHTPLSGSPVYHRVGRLGSTAFRILDMICILPTRCVCMRFGRQKGGERGTNYSSSSTSSGHMGFVRCEFLQKSAKLLPTIYPSVVQQLGPSAAFSCSFLTSALSSTS